MKDVAGNTPFWDNSGLASLKRASQSDNPTEQKKAAREAAAYFEGMFLQMMMKTAKPIGGDSSGLLKSQAQSSFQDMFESQTAMNMGRRGMGLGKIIEQQLLGKNGLERKN
jgi:Rod binding domain-containing protein